MDEENRVELDGNGNFKSLGDQLTFDNEMPRELPKDGPDPFKYTPTQADEFQQDLVLHKQRQTIREEIKTAMSSPSPKAEEEKFEDVESKIILLGESRLDDERWESDPHIQKDFSELVHTWNQKNQKNVFLLPKEDSEWGHTLPLRPGNMVIVEVPPGVASEVKRAVYQGQGGYGGRNRFEAAWATLHKLGYSSGKKPTILFPEQSKESEKKTTSNEDRWGSQKKFEEWRMKNGARR